MAGSSNCEVEKRETVNKNCKLISEWEDEHLFKSWQEKMSLRSNPLSYPTPYRCKMDSEMKRKFNPWAIEKSFSQEKGSKPATKRSHNEFEYVIEISNEKKAKFYQV